MNKLKDLCQQDHLSCYNNVSLSNKKGFLGSLIFIAFVVIVSILVVYSVAYAFTYGEETITIKEKWIKYHGQDAKYLISSDNGQVFQITDSWIKWRFDSSNLYASLDEGVTYRVNTQGWRFAFLSDYKNILEIEKVASR